MLQSFMMKKLLKSHLNKVPQDMRDKIEKMIDENPELFVKMAQEVQEEMKKGKSDMEAFQEVGKRYQSALKDALT